MTSNSFSLSLPRNVLTKPFMRSGLPRADSRMGSTSIKQNHPTGLYRDERWRRQLATVTLGGGEPSSPGEHPRHEVVVDQGAAIFQGVSLRDFLTGCSPASLRRHRTKYFRFIVSRRCDTAPHLGDVAIE